MAHVKKKHAPLPPAAAAVTTHRVTNGVGKSVPSTSNGRELELSVVLPGGMLSSITVDYSTAMADVLVLIAAKHKLTPSEHVLSVLSEETGKQLSYTSLQAIGSLQVKRVYLLSRKAPKKEEPTGVATVVVSLPRGRRTSYDFAAKTSIAHAYRVVCADKGIDPSLHSILLPGADCAQPPTELASTTLGESGIGGFSILPNKSPSRYHSMMDISSHSSQSNGLHRGQSMADKKARSSSSSSGGGFFSFFKRKKKSKEQSSDSNSSRSFGADLPEGDTEVVLESSNGNSVPSQLPPYAGTAAAGTAMPQASVMPQVHVPTASYQSETCGSAAVAVVHSADQQMPSSSKTRKKQQAPQPPSLRSAGSSGSGTSSAGGASGSASDRPPSPRVEPLSAAVTHSWASASSLERETILHGRQPGVPTAPGAAAATAVPMLQSPADLQIAAVGGAKVDRDVHGEEVLVAAQHRTNLGHHSQAAASQGSHGKKTRAPPPPSTDVDRHSSGEIYYSECEHGLANPPAASISASTPASAATATAAIASGSDQLWPVFVAPPPPMYPPPPNSPPLSGSGNSRGSGSCCSSPGSVHRELLCAGLQAAVMDQGCNAVYPGLVSHAAEIFRSASRNSEASVDTIADVTRSFEQAIVEGQNALKEQWQGMQPSIADFVASMDELTGDLQQGRTGGQTVSIASQGALNGYVAAAAPPVPESQDQRPATDDMRQLKYGGDSAMTVVPVNNVSSATSRNQAHLSSPPSSLPRGSVPLDTVTSSLRGVANIRADGAGDRSSAIGCSTSPVGNELIVGGDEPRHPFVSDRVWQELTSREQMSLPNDEVEAQRLLRQLTLPNDDVALGSVRGVKGGVRAVRSRLFADDDHTVDDASEAGAVEPVDMPQPADTVAAAVAGRAVAPAAVEGACELDRKLPSMDITDTATPKVDDVDVSPTHSLSTQVGARALSGSVPLTQHESIALPLTNCSAVAATADAVDVAPVAMTGIVMATSSVPTDAIGATVVRARPAVVSQPIAVQPSDEAKRRSLLVLAASSTAAPRPDLNDVPMPTRGSPRSEVVGTGYEEEKEVKLRAVAGRTSISSSTTQLFTRRSQPSTVLAPVEAVDSRTSSAQHAATEVSVAAVSEAAANSPTAISDGSARLPGEQRPPSMARPNVSSATSAAIGVSTLVDAAGLPDPNASCTSTVRSRSTNIVIIETAAKGKQPTGDGIQLQHNSAMPILTAAPTASNSLLPSPSRADSTLNIAVELRPAKHAGENGRVHVERQDTAASAGGTEILLSTVQNASANASAQTGLIAESATAAGNLKATAAASATHGTTFSVQRPAAAGAPMPVTQVVAPSAQLPPAEARIEAVSVASAYSAAPSGSTQLHLRESSEIKVDSGKGADPGKVDGSPHSQVGLGATTAGFPDVSSRVDGSRSNAPSINQPRKTIFSLLSSLDAKPPTVKKRSATLPLADGQTNGREESSGELKERSGSVADRLVRQTADSESHASYSNSTATVLEPLGRQNVAPLVAAEPHAGREAAVQKAAAAARPMAKLPSPSQPLQARLFTPRPFVSRQSSAGAEETGSFVLSASASERRLSTTAPSEPAAILLGAEQAQPKEPPHAFRLSVSASPADAEARRKQELVRRYEDLQKDVAAWRGQLAQNETVIRDAAARPQRHSAGPVVAPQSGGNSVSVVTEAPAASLAAATATSAANDVASTREAPATSYGKALRGTTSVPRPRLAASLPGANDNPITLESMVAQMTQVKLKPATERAAKSSKQQQQPQKPTDSRELLLQSIRDRGVRLNLVEVNDSKGEPVKSKMQEQKNPIGTNGDGDSRQTQPPDAGSSSSLLRLSSQSSSPLTLPVPPVPPPPLPPAPVSLTSPSQTSNIAKRSAAVRKAPSQSLDPREELMIAIRGFGGAVKLRTHSSSPATTPR